MKSSPQIFHMASNYFLIVFMLVLLVILLKKVIENIFGKGGDSDILNFNQLGVEDKKLFMITQINTKINKLYIDQSEHYANTFHQEIYGSPYKFAPALPRKKEKRSEMHVTFAEKPIILNESEEVNNF